MTLNNVFADTSIHDTINIFLASTISVFVAYLGYISNKREKDRNIKEKQVADNFKLITDELPRLRAENLKIFKELEICHAEKHELAKHIHRIEQTLIRNNIEVLKEEEIIQEHDING